MVEGLLCTVKHFELPISLGGNLVATPLQVTGDVQSAARAGSGLSFVFVFENLVDMFKGSQTSV